jgi:DNA polymerase III subunit epsilon
LRYPIYEYLDSVVFGLPVAVIDFETTGIDALNCRAVSMSILHANLGHDNAEVVYNQRFNPGEPIPEGASNIHGIYDKDVVGCPSFAQCYSQEGGIRDLLRGRVLVAYNLSYDWQVLNAELRRSNHLWEERYHWFGICGLVLARYVDSQRRRRGYHKLEAVCKRRGIELENAHDAMADAKATAEVLNVLLREAAEKRGKRFYTLRDLWGFQRVCAIEFESGLRDYYRTKGKDTGSWVWTDY